MKATDRAFAGQTGYVDNGAQKIMYPGNPGMDIRTWLAGMALSAVSTTMQYPAQRAVEIADDIIVELNRDSTDKSEG